MKIFFPCISNLLTYVVFNYIKTDHKIYNCPYIVRTVFIVITNIYEERFCTNNPLAFANVIVVMNAINIVDLTFDSYLKAFRNPWLIVQSIYNVSQSWRIIETDWNAWHLFIIIIT